MDGGDLHRAELGSFLRARRERMSPAQVGLPVSPRRRTPGLRREELASLAGISTTWYTFLEQGRDVRASRQVLAAIATALRLDGVERDHLFSIAAAGPAVGEELADISPEVAAVPALLEPNPAYITGSDYGLLAWNAAAADLFTGAFEDARPNLARWMFLRPEPRVILPDWTIVAQSLLARLRANAGRHPGSPRFQRLEEELRSASAEADEWWPRYDIATAQAGVKRVRMPSGAQRHLSHASFQVADRAEQVLTVYRTTPEEQGASSAT